MLANKRTSWVAGRVFAGALMMALGAAVGQITSTTTAPATAPATTTSKPALTGPRVNASVTSWSIFVTDISYAELNRRESINNSLPGIINSSRRQPLLIMPNQDRWGRPIRVATPKPQPVDVSNDPMPLSMIRIKNEGNLNPDVLMDVQLSFKNGRMLGHWPPAKTRSNGLLWQDLHLAGPEEKPRELKDSWLLAARHPNAQLVTVGKTTEAFLLYDLELNYPVTLQVTLDDQKKYKVAQAGDAPMKDLTFYKRDEKNGYRIGTLASLTKAGAATGPATATAASAPATAAAPVRPRGRRPTATGPGDENATASTPSVARPPAATLPGATPMELNTEVLPDAKALDSWRKILTDADVSAADQELILKILAQHALGTKRLTAIYRMDDAEVERLMPLEIVPQPKKVSRIALVVVTGIDPAVGEELEQLVKQLGAKTWEERDAAMAEIQKLGARAKPFLDKAAKDKDVEVQYRAEQLLQILKGDVVNPNEAQEGG
jgi:hypothetical protein